MHNSNKDKLPRLVHVNPKNNVMRRKHFPVVVDEHLTLVMSLKSSALLNEDAVFDSRELEEFNRKYNLLNLEELDEALRICKVDFMHVLSQHVGCVGCRRSVERVYYELFKYGHNTLYPLRVMSDGSVIIVREKLMLPHALCSIFQDHSARLSSVLECQPKSTKKSFRCVIHSMDVQRGRSPISPVWREVWDCMQMECKRDVCIIDSELLQVTLETYLKKHRFCCECRTKVLKAYSLLVEEDEPFKEKGYVEALYADIRRCVGEKHVHLQPKGDFVVKLISRAEPELLGGTLFSRRERHAKTLEIAQEEVLTCLGVCLYERLNRIYLRVREEEYSCLLFAAVAVDTLHRSFEMSVESKQGVTQLELLYAEIELQEHQSNLRRLHKRLKRKRKKNALKVETDDLQSGTLATINSTLEGNESLLQSSCDEEASLSVQNHHDVSDVASNGTSSSCDCDEAELHEQLSSDNEDAELAADCHQSKHGFDNENCDCGTEAVEYSSGSSATSDCEDYWHTNPGAHEYMNGHELDDTKPNSSSSSSCDSSGGAPIGISCDDWTCGPTSNYPLKTKRSPNCDKLKSRLVRHSRYSNGSSECGSVVSNGSCESSISIESQSASTELDIRCNSCGLSETPASRKLSAHRHQHPSPCQTVSNSKLAESLVNGRHKLSDMRTGSGNEFVDDGNEGDDDDEDSMSCKLTFEEVREFEFNNKHVHEQRQQLREALRQKFVDFCLYGGPLKAFVGRRQASCTKSQ